MKGSSNPLASVLAELSSVEQLCLASNEKANALSGLLKKVYDFASSQGCKAGSIDELIIENVDAETIWEELNSRNLPLVRQLTSKIARLNRSIDESKVQVEEATDDESQQDEYQEDSEEEHDNDGMSHSEINYNSEEDEGEESDGGIPDNGSDGDETEGNDTANDGHSESDMEKWLDDMDEDEMKRNDANYESDEDDVYVSNALYEDEGEGADYRYSDYFKDGDKDRDDYRDEEGDDDDEEQEEDDATEGEDSEEEEENDEDEDRSEDDENERNTNKKKTNEKLSTFQTKNQKLSNQITDLESQLLKEKSWDMKGEVKASDRPENSLLETYADIERLSKPTPVITETSTNDLETIIKDRIKNSRFNDVPVYREPVADKKPADTFELSQSKNTTGLGELYAQEFLAKSLNSQPEHVSNKLAAAREDALALFHKVSMKLDELSHFFYSPRPVTAEINVKSFAPIAALPSINLEEVVPVVGSNASQSAPEEVMHKKRGRTGEDMTKADKKKLRKLRGKTDTEEESDSKKRKTSRGNDSDDEGGAIHDRRVSTGSTSRSGGENGSFSKSATFFANLQSHAQAEISGIKNAVAAAGKKKGKDLKNTNYKL